MDFLRKSTGLLALRARSPWTSGFQKHCFWPRTKGPLVQVLHEAILYTVQVLTTTHYPLVRVPYEYRYLYEPPCCGRRWSEPGVWRLVRVRIGWPIRA